MGVLDALFARFMGANFVTDDPAEVLYGATRCRELGVFNGDAGACRAASIAHHAEELIAAPLAVGAFAFLLLMVFAAARRVPWLGGVTRLPNTAMLSTAGAVGFGGVGLVLLAYGILGVALGQRVEVGAHLAEGLAGVAAGLVFVPHAWRQVSLQASG